MCSKTHRLHRCNHFFYSPDCRGSRANSFLDNKKEQQQRWQRLSKLPFFAARSAFHSSFFAPDGGALIGSAAEGSGGDRWRAAAGERRVKRAAGSALFQRLLGVFSALLLLHVVDGNTYPTSGRDLVSAGFYGIKSNQGPIWGDILR